MNDLLTRQSTPSVTKDELDHTVDTLRGFVALAEEPTAEKLQSVLELTVQGHGPTTIAHETGLSRDELKEAIKAMGRRFRARQDEAPDLYGTALFPLEPDPEVLAKLSTRRRKAAQEKAAKLRAENPLPFAWQVEFSETTIRKAVAAIRNRPEVDDNLQSLALRATAAETPPLSGLTTFQSLRATWMLIQLGQLRRVAQDPDLPLKAAETLVLSYDALETARADSVEAMLKLRTNPEPEELDSLAVRARPLSEAAVRRLEQVLAHTRREERLAGARFRGINQFLDQTGQMNLPTHVGELNEGQVHRIGLMLGLETEPISDRDARAADERLTDMDMADDIPWLKGLWISARSCRREDDFWDAVKRLSEGDVNWVQPLR